MKILCVCERGNSRSVALAYMLKDGFGQDAIAMGIRAQSDSTKNMLYEWAEVIILVHQRLEHEIPTKYKSKLKVWNVGPDIYFRGFDTDLLEQYERYLDEWIDEGWS